MTTVTPEPALTGPSLDRKDNAVAICLAVLLFAVYLFTFRGGFHSVDEVSMFAVTESMGKRASFDTNAIAWTQWTTTQREAQGFFGPDGNVYSKKGLALSLFALPLYRLALRVPEIGLLQATTLINALVTAATGLVLYLFARRLGYSPTVGAALALVFGVATSAWVYARYLFSEPVAGFLLLSAAYLLLGFRQTNRGLFVFGAGLAAGLAVLARANNLICVPLFGLYLLVALIDTHQGMRLRSGWWRYLLVFGVAAGVGLAIMAAYNGVRSGNPLQTGYDLGIFSSALGFGLYKLLFSPLRGFFWFSPVLLLTLLAVIPFTRRHRAEALLCVGIIAVNLLLFAAWTSGEGLSWGSRFLVPVIAFWVLPLAEPLDAILTRRRWAWLIGLLALGAPSLAVQILGVAVNPWLYMARLQGLFPVEFLENSPALYEVRYSPILGQLQELLVPATGKFDIAWAQPSGVLFVPALVSLVLIAGAVFALLHLLKLGSVRGFALIGITGAMIVLAAAVSLVTLRGYYGHDYQFGAPDNGLDRILTRLSAEAGTDDAIVTVAPYHYHVPMNAYRGKSPMLGFAKMDSPLEPHALALLERTVAQHRRVWMITAGVAPGDQQNGVERWLADKDYKATDEWFDDLRLCLFASSADAPPAAASDASFGDSIRLVSYAIAPPAAGLLPMQLDWESTQVMTASLNVFVHLVSAEGVPIAQRDAVPAGGFRPTNDWTPGPPIADRFALRLPPGAEGRYEVWVGMYDPKSGSRLPVRLSNGTTGDHLLLGAVELAEN